MLRLRCRRAPIASAPRAAGNRRITRAAVDALTPPTGPVKAEVPIDLQRTPVERSSHFRQLALLLPLQRTPSDSRPGRACRAHRGGEAADVQARFRRTPPECHCAQAA